MKQTTIIALISLFAQLNLWAQKTRTDSMQQAVCPVVKIQPEQLPSLNTPRSGHHTLCVNGEITVFGGHTSGFVPTPTAEYFKDGAWHQMDMVYTHDDGSALILKLSVSSSFTNNPSRIRRLKMRPIHPKLQIQKRVPMQNSYSASTIW